MVVVVVVVVVVLVLVSMLVGVAQRTSRPMHVPIPPRPARSSDAVIVLRTVRARIGVLMTIGLRTYAARRHIAVCVLAARRRRVAGAARLRVARVGAAGRGAVGMAVSWVGGTLGVGHEDLLYGWTR
nr:hypothetical protein [Burkholderia vietnamiensis]